MALIEVNSSGWPEREDLDELAEEHLKRYFGTLFRTAVKLSPVYTGSYRASWRVALNEVRDDVTTRTDPMNPIRGASFRWPAGFQLGDVVIVSNNQPYAELIEYGAWSKQAPYGTIRMAIAFAEAEIG